MFRYASRRRVHILPQKRRFSTTVPESITRLERLDLQHFQNAYFKPGNPVTFPSGSFESLPAISRWFTLDKSGAHAVLAVSYLRSFEDITVPVEVYTPAQGEASAKFERGNTTLGLCMQMMHAAQQQNEAHVYIAQCPLADLPQKLQSDVPTPNLVKHAGRGDVYDSSVWIGYAPTYTSLHKDPNPNLFVQLCGTKVVRLLNPTQGEIVMQRVRRATLKSGTSSAVRGEEMMAGLERDLLEKFIWDEPEPSIELLECELTVGDGLFIPKGWWHSIKGVGNGINGSVSPSIILANLRLAQADAEIIGQLVVPLIQTHIRAQSKTFNSVSSASVHDIQHLLTSSESEDVCLQDVETTTNVPLRSACNMWRNGHILELPQLAVFWQRLRICDIECRSTQPSIWTTRLSLEPSYKSVLVNNASSADVRNE